MAKNNRNLLKTYFQTGDIPSEGQYINFIDSSLNLKEEGTEIAASSISASSLISATHITANGDISSSANLLGKQIGIGTVPSNVTSFNTNGNDIEIHVSASKPRVWVESMTGAAEIKIASNNPSLTFAKTIWTGSSDLSGNDSASYLEWRLQNHNTSQGVYNGRGGYPFTFSKVNKFGNKETVFKIYSQSRQDSLHLSGSVTQYSIGGNNPATIGSTFVIGRYGADIVNGIITMFSSGSGDSKVAIGYETPTSRLHVSGAIHASGSFGNVTADMTGSFPYITSSGEIVANTLTLGGTNITSTGTEINYLDGVLSTVKNAYDTFAYNTHTGVITLTELDNGTETFDLGIGRGDEVQHKSLNLTGKEEGAIAYTWDGAPIDSAGARCFRISTFLPALSKLFTEGSITELQTVDSLPQAQFSTIIATCDRVGIVIDAFTTGTTSFQFQARNVNPSSVFAGGESNIAFTIL